MFVKSTVKSPCSQWGPWIRPFSSPEPVVSWSRGRETRGSGRSRYRMSENFWHPVAHVQKLQISLLMLLTGAIHSTKISGSFGPKLNGSVRSNRKSFEKTGPPFEMVLFSRSDGSECWLNGSRPTYFCPSPLHWGKNFTFSALSREWLLWDVLKMHHFTQLGFTDNLENLKKTVTEVGWTHCWFAELRQLIDRLSSELCEFFFQSVWRTNTGKAISQRSI